MMHLKLLMAIAIFLAPVMFSLAGVVQAVNEPTVTVTATDAAAAETGGNTGTFTVTRTGDTTAGLMVHYTVSGTATAGTDYTALSGTILILPGASDATITVTPIDDALIEGPETVIVTLSADAAYVVGAPSSAIVTIADDEQPSALPVVTIAATDANAAEDGGDTGTFTVMRAGDTTVALTVHYTVGGTATAGTDYAALSGAVTIPAAMSSATILVTPLSDSLVEGPETVIVTLSADAAYTVGSANSATVTIMDNDQPSALPVVTIAATDAIAAEDGGDTGTFTVMRAGDTTVALTVHYTVGGTATAGTDYAALSGAVTIPAAMSSATILVTPLSDSLVEGPETVIVTLSADAAYTVGSANSATVTIAADQEEENHGGNHPDGTRPGWGCGDTNHVHTGPPGNGGDRESPCDGGHEHENHGAASNNAEDGHGRNGNHGRGHH